jgi:hypothetical protein
MGSGASNYNDTATITYNGDGPKTWTVSIPATQIYGYDPSFTGVTTDGLTCEASTGDVNCGPPGGDCNQASDAGFTFGTAPCTQAAIIDVSAVPTSRARAPRLENYGPGLGTDFANDNAELFVGCGCKKDLIQVMNRWQKGEVTAKQIDRVARTLQAKATQFTVEEIAEAIEEVVG